MMRVWTILLLLHVALLVVALVDCVSATDRRIRLLPRTVWLFVILLTAPIGAIAWFVAGKPEPVIRLSDGRILQVHATPPTRLARPRQVVAAFIGPEDDPDFVRGLAQDLERRRAQES